MDGVIVAGETSVDQSVMTGESIPVDKGAGEAVYCGTINRFGAVDIRATKVGADSSLQKLIRMVQEAENNQAPMQRIADKCASWFVPAALLIAIITWGVTKDILEKMGKADTIAFDKTGTLTFGRLEVSDIVSFDDAFSENELLAFTASAESKSEHPLGKAIIAYAEQKKVPLPESDHFKMESGKGICAEVSGRQLSCGNETFFAENGIEIYERIRQTVESFRMQGKASVLVADQKNCIGVNDAPTPITTYVLF